MGGTLRRRVPDEAWQRRSRERLLAMLGQPDAPASYLDELTRRYKSYTRWAQEHTLALSEAEVWTQWMAPELPRESIAPQAVELMLVWRDRIGPAVLKPDARQVIAELSRRGYRLGVISNTTSSIELGGYLQKHGLAGYFETVVLSAAVGRCKPCPEIFWEATRAMRIEPASCAYLGNNVLNDMIGSRRAGFALAVLVESPDAPHRAAPGPGAPDAVIRELRELLDIFPPRGR